MKAHGGVEVQLHGFVGTQEIGMGISASCRDVLFPKLLTRRLDECRHVLRVETEGLMSRGHFSSSRCELFFYYYYYYYY
jgi:hypothetical protein